MKDGGECNRGKCTPYYSKMNDHTALLVVDVQNAMFTYPDFKLHNEEKVLDNITSMVEKAREVNMPIVYIQHTEDDSEYKEGSSTWEIHQRIKPRSTDIVVQKGTCDSFYQTNLQEELNKLQIEKLVIVGMQTEFCIDTTVRSAFSKGYNNILVKDAHSTFDNGKLIASQIINHHNDILGGGRFAILKETKDISFE
ncbi:nicotinamidase-related amidase [Bacillus sp. OAE603]